MFLFFLVVQDSVDMESDSEEPVDSTHDDDMADDDISSSSYRPLSKNLNISMSLQNNVIITVVIWRLDGCTFCFRSAIAHLRISRKPFMASLNS